MLNHHVVQIDGTFYQRTHHPEGGKDYHVHRNGQWVRIPAGHRHLRTRIDLAVTDSAIGRDWK